MSEIVQRRTDEENHMKRITKERLKKIGLAYKFIDEDADDGLGYMKKVVRLSCRKFFSGFGLDELDSHIRKELGWLSRQTDQFDKSPLADEPIKVVFTWEKDKGFEVRVKYEDTNKSVQLIERCVEERKMEIIKEISEEEGEKLELIFSFDYNEGCKSMDHYIEREVERKIKKYNETFKILEDWLNG